MNQPGLPAIDSQGIAMGIPVGERLLSQLSRYVLKV